MIALIDYGSGNLRSVHKALLKVGAQVRIVQRPDGIADARAVVLPGVGAFDDCIQALQKQQLLAAARRFIQSGKPFLGICVGYQALFEKSDEFNSLRRRSRRVLRQSRPLPPNRRTQSPQIGWNQLDIVQPDCPLYRGIPQGSYVYFVHSFFPKPADPTIVAPAPLRRNLRILRLPRQRPSPPNSTPKRARRSASSCSKLRRPRQIVQTLPCQPDPRICRRRRQESLTRSFFKLRVSPTLFTPAIPSSFLNHPWLPPNGTTEAGLANGSRD